MHCVLNSCTGTDAMFLPFHSRYLWMQMMPKLRSASYSTWLPRPPFIGPTGMLEEKAVAADRQLMVMVMATHKSCSFKLLRPLLVVLCLHIHGKKGTMNMLLL